MAGHYPRKPRGGWAPGARPWDIHDDVLLINLFHQGLSDRAIAEKMGRPLGAVTKRRQRKALAVSPARQAAHRREARVGRESPA